MPRAWRICLARHADDGAHGFSGTGARLFGGRWNSKGVGVGYGSTTLSLAALEYLVHAEPGLLSEVRLVACSVSWPDDLAVERVSARRLGTGWRETPPPAALAAIGDRWVAGGQSAILIVPSAIVPAETNVLVNPDHPDVKRLQGHAPEPFAYDPRLLRRKG